MDFQDRHAMIGGKVVFAREKETLLITLYGRALQSRSARPILKDPWAEEAVGRIDYDFAKLKVGPRAGRLFAARAKQLDAWTSDFLARYPNTVVLHLGCGLDARAFRVDPPETVLWYDVDFPDVIALRKRFYQEQAGYRMVGASLDDLDWLRELPRGRPGLVVAEGVMMYLTEAVVKRLLNRAVDCFPFGQATFDAHTPQMIKLIRLSGSSIRGTGATFSWAVSDPEEVTRLEPRLEFITERRAQNLVGSEALSRSLRYLLRAADLLLGVRVMRCLLYRFPAAKSAA